MLESFCQMNNLDMKPTNSFSVRPFLCEKAKLAFRFANSCSDLELGTETIRLLTDAMMDA